MNIVLVILPKQQRREMMNTSVNDSGLLDMFIDPVEVTESYECNETSESIERIYNIIQSYKAGFSDREYNFYE